MPFLHTFYRKYLVLCGLVACCFLSNAQKNDYIWLTGYHSYDPGDSATYGYKFGITELDFSFDPVMISYDSLGMQFDKTNTTYSDDDGNLLFYTNGIYVANALDEVIQNSVGLNEGWLYQVWDPSIQSRGYRNVQGILALPNMSNIGQYYLVHSFADSIPGSGGSNVFFPKIFNSLIDMSANGNHGQMVYKNELLLQGSFGYELTATKHANGRDWWIVIQKKSTNCYYRILLDPTDFHVLNNLSCGGNIVVEQNACSACFSPDGTKFAHYDAVGGINLFNFDRCRGELSNPIFIPLDIYTDSMWLANGLAFSPNGRFLYVSATKVMLQYDTWANDIAASVDTVGIYDGYYLSNISIIQSLFHTAQLAPDGKIYISCGNTINTYHVINNPDEKGIQCNFVQHGFMLKSLSNSIPNYPNYRLGALVGSACDTITTLTPTLSQRERELKVFPNPATDAVTVDYGFTNWEKGDVDLEITNAAGQLVHSQHLPMYSGFQRLDVMQYAAGVYNVAIKRGNAVVSVSQFVKQ